MLSLSLSILSMFLPHISSFTFCMMEVKKWNINSSTVCRNIREWVCLCVSVWMCCSLQPLFWILHLQFCVLQSPFSHFNPHSILFYFSSYDFSLFKIYLFIYLYIYIFRLFELYKIISVFSCIFLIIFFLFFFKKKSIVNIKMAYFLVFIFIDLSLSPSSLLFSLNFFSI